MPLPISTSGRLADNICRILSSDTSCSARPFLGPTEAKLRLPSLQDIHSINQILVQNHIVIDVLDKFLAILRLLFRDSFVTMVV